MRYFCDMGLRHFYIILCTLLCAILLCPVSQAQESYEEKHIEVTLRMMGHQLLLSAGDPVSRVLPIVKDSGRYSIKFESEFAFLPDSLVAVVNRVVKQSRIKNGYIVQVKNCKTNEIVYAYEVYEEAAWNGLPCKGRFQPRDCYELLFTLKELKNPEAASVIATNPTLEEISTKRSEVNYLAITLFVLLLAVIGFFLWKRKQVVPVDPNLVPLGQYYFDKTSTELLIENERIKLTSKEADLLLLLYNEVNTTIERDVILNKVWGDEGAYVGRTLDVFISKLRKKLEADSRVKIVNIRGVGYKLVIAA